MKIWRRTRNAAVLGCGPAGAFAAHALVQLGWDVTIFSKDTTRSEMFGAQYLHEPIPGLDGEGDPFPIDYQLRGSVEAYRAKVYAARTDLTVSPDILLGEHKAWDIRAAYYDAWVRYSPLLRHRRMDYGEVSRMIDAKEYRLIISSVPAHAVCQSPAAHGFNSQVVWASGDAPERGVYCPVDVPEGTVICNGERSPAWYRASKIKGFRTCEWPMGTKPPVQVSMISKPISTTCTCHPTMRRVGRYGTWTKGVLAHSSYKTAWNAATSVAS